MKICHITNVHGVFDGRIFHKMACSAVEFGYSVTLIAPHNKEEVRNGVRIIPIKKSSNRLRRYIDSFKLLKLMLEVDADIYHFHDPELITVMKMFQRRSSKKIIYDIHEYYKEVMLSKTWIPKGLRKMISRITWHSEINACKTFDCIIAATKELSYVYEPYSKNNNFILNFDFKKGISIDQNNQRHDIDIIHVGSLSQNRLEFFLEIVKVLEQRGKLYTWYFIGVPKTLIDFKNSKLSHRLNSIVNMTEKIPFEDVQKYYKRSRIGINYHPMEKRFLVAIPMKVFEYMKYGLTVITSDLPPLRKYIENDINGYISINNSVTEFADLIEKAFSINKFEEIGLRNKNDIFEKYNWENESQKLMKIYEDLLEV